MTLEAFLANLKAKAAAAAMEPRTSLLRGGQFIAAFDPQVVAALAGVAEAAAGVSCPTVYDGVCHCGMDLSKGKHGVDCDWNTMRKALDRLAALAEAR